MTKDPIEARLNRIEGQLKAIKNMYMQGKNCNDIVQQIQAARSAMGKVAGLLLTNEAKRCNEEGDVDGFERVVDKAFNSI